MYTTLEARKSNLWRNVAEKGREQATFKTAVLIATKARPQAADLVHESEPLDMRRHLLVHHHLSCLLVRSRLMRPRLLSRTLPPFLRPRNSELESKLVSLDDIINRCDYFVFFELNKRSFNKILNAENTEPVIIRTITKAMRAKAWNDVTSPILRFARSCYKELSL